MTLSEITPDVAAAAVGGALATAAPAALPLWTALTRAERVAVGAALIHALTAHARAIENREPR